MKVTKHANDRLKERNGLNKKSRDRIAEKALTEGITHGQTKGNLQKWVTSIYFRNTAANNIRLYGDKAYIFTDDTLITVLQIPANLVREMPKMIKKKKPE